MNIIYIFSLIVLANAQTFIVNRPIPPFGEYGAIKITILTKERDHVE